MAEINQNQLLMATLEGHRVPFTDRGDFLELDGTDIKMRASAFTNLVPSKNAVQLDIKLRSQQLLGDRMLVESYAGVGETLEASIGDAFVKYLRSSSHPILSAFVNRNLEPEQVQWEQWMGKEISWDVCYGPLLYISNPPTDFQKIIKKSDFDALINRIRDIFLSEVSSDIHWIRLFYGSVDGNCAGREVLLDSKLWKSGLEFFEKLSWPAQPSYYSIRAFMITVPAQPKKKGWKFWEK